MQDYRFEKLELSGAYYIEYFYADDNRGGFTKNYKKDIFESAGITFELSESFVSNSSRNVIRGIHFQLNKPQAKIISVVKGRVWDVIADLRINSPTYKKWLGFEISEDKHNGLYIPRGFGHGFVALEDECVMLYQCDGEYDRDSDAGIIFDDEILGIDWPIDVSEAILSERDLKLMSLNDYEKLENRMTY